ncbi:MAG: hypothetical protein JNL82_30840 [Myxococcales bacterium]|nr:hypothetical protein [Myxococcales bacterium]
MTRNFKIINIFGLLSGLLLATCGPEDDPGSFPCGDQGGSCDRDTEVCIVGADCSTCAPKPEACDPIMTCGCLPPGTDPGWAPYGCTDEGSCAELDGGLVLTCTPDGWGCG